MAAIDVGRPMQLAGAISDRRAAVLARRPKENVESFTNEPQRHQRGTKRVRRRQRAAAAPEDGRLPQTMSKERSKEKQSLNDAEATYVSRGGNERGRRRGAAVKWPAPSEGPYYF